MLNTRVIPSLLLKNGGLYKGIVKNRNKTMLEAQKRNPHRWSKPAKQLPEKHIVYLNPSADSRIFIKATKEDDAA